LSTTIPLVPPEAAAVLAVAVGVVPAVTLKDMMQPLAKAGHPIGGRMFGLACTLTKIQSVLPLRISVGGEHVVLAVLTAVAIALGVPNTLAVIGTRYNVAFPPGFPQTYRFPVGLAELADV
jgi:hypothetical protein